MIDKNKEPEEEHILDIVLSALTAGVRERVSEDPSDISARRSLVSALCCSVHKMLRDIVPGVIDAPEEVFLAVEQNLLLAVETMKETQTAVKPYIRKLGE